MVAPALDAKPRARARARRRSAGFTLVEALIAISIALLIASALGFAMETTFAVERSTRAQNALAREAGFAMERMVRFTRRSPWLVLPQSDSPLSAWNESVRDPGVLALCLDPELDRDMDGTPDADNDRDGRVDEDPPSDRDGDFEHGIAGLDDDGDSEVDEDPFFGIDDDEDGDFDEDPANGLDDDGDGRVDEDTSWDLSLDGAAGVRGADDDGDGQVDEGAFYDDDEDGKGDEDWMDVVVYSLEGSALIERFPNPSAVSGTDYTKRVIAEDVSLFRVERVARDGRRNELVDITLELSRSAASVRVNARVRVGGAL